VTLYLDTSSLVKLYLSEPGSDSVEELVGRATVLTTSVVAYAEGRAAFAKLRRIRDITSAAATSMATRFDADWGRVMAIEVTAPLARRAGQLADRFDLRGFDAIHLASFELILERAGDQDEVHFSSGDATLSRAAKRLG
jgi:predicted nucleic acid-binding protein